MLGQVDIVVTHTAKLLSDSGEGLMGLMAMEQENGSGPYFSTPGVGLPGTNIWKVIDPKSHNRNMENENIIQHDMGCFPLANTSHM